MSGGLMALLAGLFIAPAVLLWLGHRLRHQDSARRRVFWGALAGHTLGMMMTMIAVHYPPVLWGGGWRDAAVHWAMLVGGMIGAGAGWLAGRVRG